MTLTLRTLPTPTPFTKLSDLTTFHLNRTNITLPNNAPPSKLTNLSQLTAAAGLQTLPTFGQPVAGSAVGFRIPQLASASPMSSQPPASSNATTLGDLMSLRKMMDMQKNALPNGPTLSNHTQQSTTAVASPSASSIVVNLTAAAAQNVVRRSSATNVGPQAAAIDDNMLPIEPICHPCDPSPALDAHIRGGAKPAAAITSGSTLLAALAENLNVQCQIDVSALAGRHLTQKTSRRSRIGRILCLRYAVDRAVAARALRRVRHDFAGIAVHPVKVYGFEKPSPDDVILRQLSKWKKQ